MEKKKSIFAKIIFRTGLFRSDFSRKEIGKDGAAKPSPLLVVLFFLLCIAYSVLAVNYADLRKGIEYADLYEAAQEAVEPDVAMAVSAGRPNPDKVKALYASSWTASHPRMDDLIELVKRTELNAIVIDIKDCTGKVFIDADVPLADEIGAKELRVRDFPGLIEKLHDNGIYAIARLVVFQDPILANARPDLAVLDKRTGKVWKNYKGLSWADSGSQEAWKYVVDIAKEAIDMGFDEINFDYVRFPSDGNLKQMSFQHYDGQSPKHETIASFFEYLSESLKGRGAYLSADLFGLAFYQDDGLNIGQKLSALVPHMDYLYPMAYPSHYWSGFEGFANPAEHPYEVMYRTLIASEPIFAKEDVRAQFRPWIQDFDLGANYDAAMVRAQIKAADDAGADGWLLWNASNRYTEGALLPAE